MGKVSELTFLPRRYTEAKKHKKKCSASAGGHTNPDGSDQKDGAGEPVLWGWAEGSRLGNQSGGSREEPRAGLRGRA